MSKSKTKSRSKSKARLKTKTKVKLKSKAKPRKKVKAKSKTKTRTKAKVKAKARKKVTVRAKIKVKAKAKTKTKAKAKAKPKKRSKIKQAKKAGPKLTNGQKTILLETIKKIVELRKHKTDGLKSLDHIDRILDQYNQKFTVDQDKFDAIVDFSVGEHSRYASEYGFIALKDDNKSSVALYTLLAEIGRGKKKFPEARDKINSIYEEALEE